MNRFDQLCDYLTIPDENREQLSRFVAEREKLIEDRPIELYRALVPFGRQFPLSLPIDYSTFKHLCSNAVKAEFSFFDLRFVSSAFTLTEAKRIIYRRVLWELARPSNEQQ
jgi:hypothetical protein